MRKSCVRVVVLRCGTSTRRSRRAAALSNGTAAQARRNDRSRHDKRLRWSPSSASRSRVVRDDGFTYLLYRNGCEKKCGMNDLVVLDSGKVVDAVFRSSSAPIHRHEQLAAHDLRAERSGQDRRRTARSAQNIKLPGTPRSRRNPTPRRRPPRTAPK